jgi:colicin import membrane protein
MAALAFAKDPLLPRPPGGTGQGAVLAVLAHAGLLGALAIGTQWRTQTPTDVSAELWAAVPQMAAPMAALPPPPLVKPTPPVVAAPAPPPPVQRDADIATERATERAKKEAEKKDLDKREAEKRDAEKKAQDKLQEEAEAKKRAKAEELKAWQQARAEEERLAKQREDNLRRMMGQAGDAAPANPSTGTAAQNAAPSASYAGRLKALILSNMVFTGAVEANSAAEVEVRTAPSGTILSRRLLKSSGHTDWDEAVLRAIDRTATLPRDTDGRVPPALTFVFRPRE